LAESITKLDESLALLSDTRKVLKLTDEELALIYEPKHPYEFGILEAELNFEEAHLWYGIPVWKAILTLVISVLFYLMQVTLYLLMLDAYWLLIDDFQKVLAVAVAVRECILAALVLYFLVVYQGSVFLAPVMPDSWCDLEEVLYFVRHVGCPEQRLIQGMPSLLDLTLLQNLVTFINLCAVEALYVAFVSGRTYTPLVIGYAITATSFLSWQVSHMIHPKEAEERIPSPEEGYYYSGNTLPQTRSYSAERQQQEEEGCSLFLMPWSLLVLLVLGFILPPLFYWW